MITSSLLLNRMFMFCVEFVLVMQTNEKINGYSKIILVA